MKRRYIWSLAVVILAGTAIFAWDYFTHRLPSIPVPKDSRAQAGLAITAVTLPDGVRIAAEVVRTPKQHARGLMYRDAVPHLTGMLFVYEEEKYQQIWMKNVRIDLDVIFMDADKRITHIEKNLKHSPENTPESDVSRVNGYGKYILELGAGEAERLKLAKGMQLSFL